MSRIANTIHRAELLSLTALVATACARSRAPQEPIATTSPCQILSAPSTSQRVDSLSIALLSANAPTTVPSGRTPTERFVHAQAFETLIRVDCDGNVRPALAQSWSADVTRRRWTFVLREDARFWSGDRVTANDVIATWNATAVGSSGAFARRILDSAIVVDSRTLAVTLPDTTPFLLADAQFAISRVSSGSSQPEGTGPFRVLSAPGAPTSGVVTLVPSDSAVRQRITVRGISVTHARDLLDAGVNVLLSDDPAVVSYASSRSDLAVEPLPWDRTYVLVSPSRAGAPGARSPSVDTSAAQALRADLARDAVRAEARAALGPAWWEMSQGCLTLPSAADLSPPAAATLRVVYDRSDAVAQGLAERLVALAAFDRSRAPGASVPALGSLAPELAAAGASATAAGLTQDELVRKLRAGTELAFVIALPRRSLAPCRDTEELISAAPWIAALLRDARGERALASLIETRRRAIVRRDRVGLTVDWDGTLRLSDDVRGAGGKAGAP